jgi:hypothetical protein
VEGAVGVESATIRCGGGGGSGVRVRCCCEWTIHITVTIEEKEWGCQRIVGGGGLAVWPKGALVLGESCGCGRIVGEQQAL